MKVYQSYLTSFNSLFGNKDRERPAILEIKVPMIQRDYAQGRAGTAVERIRNSFLDVLRRALTEPESVNLDFVYGSVEDGVLQPLDGQQRLTTLFLLHWYIASRAGRLGDSVPWSGFRYATRPSAGTFCENLTKNSLPEIPDAVSEWIRDQIWYRYTWKHDPTIESMLTMLNDIQKCFQDTDCAAAWDRLVSVDNPAITFHLLPMDDMKQSSELYIKMNSRGKPLTPFENFKARFEQLIEQSCPQRLEDFSKKIDGEWVDVFWNYRGSDNLLDDEMLRYIEYVTELLLWREGIPENPGLHDVIDLAEQVYGTSNPNAADHLHLLEAALDIWVRKDAPAIFDSLFTIQADLPKEEREGRLFLFNQEENDLLRLCCDNYERPTGSKFGLSQKLLLYAVILHRMHNTEDFDRRLRVLRNLIVATGGDLVLDRMPAFVKEVEQLVRHGLRSELKTFNQAQVRDEVAKAQFLKAHAELEPHVFLLEDHSLLRGSLVAFELDADLFKLRADTFRRVFSDKQLWPALTGALLAIGDYSRKVGPRYQFGTGSKDNDKPWRDLLTRGAREDLVNTREIVGALLDAIASADTDVSGMLGNTQTQWLSSVSPQQGLSWRWYLVKYPIMRSGRSGMYQGPADTLGYSFCMLNYYQLKGYYRDPFLSAVHELSGVGEAVDPLDRFSGLVTNARLMRLKKSSVAIQCVEEGFLLAPPFDPAYNEAFSRVCSARGVGADNCLLIPQVEHGGLRLDTCDRVAIGAALLQDLVKAGL